MKQQSNDSAAAETLTVRLTWAEHRPEDFIELLQRGFQLRVHVGFSVRDVLCEQLGVAHEYLDGRINTIFLDGSPVDDVDSATITEGSILALSAAMPGFVGAAMRKGGYYARMRDSITYTGADHEPSARVEGFFTLKLFNIVARELGSLFLAHGLWLDRGDFDSFMGRRSEEFWSRCLKAEVDGGEIELSGLAKGKFPGEAPRICLKCDMAAESSS